MPIKPLNTIPLARCTACGHRVLNPNVGTPCPQCGGRLATWDHCVACGKADWLGSHHCDARVEAGRAGALNRWSDPESRAPSFSDRLADGANALGRAEPKTEDAVLQRWTYLPVGLRVGDFVFIRARRQGSRRAGRVVELRGSADPVTVAWDATFSDPVLPEEVAEWGRGWRAMRLALRRGTSIETVRELWGRLKPEEQP